MSTQFEAQFFCQVNTGPNSKQICYLGRIGSVIDKSKTEIVSGQAVNFIQWLFQHLPRFNPTVPFQSDSNTKYSVWFETNNDGQLLIYLFAGQEIPTYQILSLKPTLITEESRQFVTYDYQLSMGTQFYAEDKNVFLMLLNALLKISNSEHEKFLERKHYLRFFLLQESPEFPPLAKVYFREISYAWPQHQEALNRCPSDRLPCEINTLYQGHFLFIPKQKWIDCIPITLDDLMGGD